MKTVYFKNGKKIQLGAILIFILILFLLLTPTSMGTHLQTSQEFDNINGFSSNSRSRNNDWSSLRLWSDKDELFAVAVGDVDPTHQGDEIIVGGNSNKVTVVYGFGTTWTAETVFTDKWYVTAVAVGDVYPEHPGSEIVVVGWSTKVTMVYKDVETGKWISEELYQDYDWLYDVQIGDLDPRYPGNEIMVVGDPRHVLVLHYSTDSQTWEHELVWRNSPGGINVITIGDFSATHPGLELAVTGSNVDDLKLRMISYNQTKESWDIEIMGEVEKEPIEMVVGDFYSQHPGDELALVSIQRHVLMIHEGAVPGNWVMKKIWKDFESIRDVEVADLVPGNSGSELMVVGYSNLATIISEDEDSPNGFTNSSVYNAGTNMNGLAIGEFDAFHKGMEVGVIQSGGNLNLLKQPSGLVLYTPNNNITLPAGIEISIPIIVTESSNLYRRNEMKVLNSEDLSNSGISTSLSMYDKIITPELVMLNVTIPENTSMGGYNIELLVRPMTIDPDYYQLNITIEVLSQNTQGFNISISPKRDEIIRDFSGRYDLMVNHFNNGMGGLELSIRYLPPGMSYQLDYEKLYPDRSTILILTTTSSTPIGKYFIFITGISNSDNSNYYTEVLVLNVVSQKPIFYFAPEEAELKLSINKETEFSIECLSIFGFDGEVRFQLLDLPDTIKTDLGNKIVKPPENITIKFTPGIETKLGEYTVTLLGLAVGSTLTNSAKLFIIVNPQEPTFNISVRPVDELVINTSEKGVIDLEIEPIAGFAGLVNVTVQGLPVGMSWNHEQFPVNISESTDISLEIKNTTEVGDFDITIIFTDESGNITIERDLVLKVYPMDEDADNGDGDSILYQIIILIILLIIIIIIFKLITRKPKKQNKQNARKKK